MAVTSFSINGKDTTGMNRYCLKISDLAIYFFLFKFRLEKVDQHSLMLINNVFK